MLQGIKILEKNLTVLGHVLMWADLLARLGDLVHRDYPFLRFGTLQKFDIGYGLDDREWLSHEDLDVADDGLQALGGKLLFGS